MVVPRRDESLTDARTWQERLRQGVERGEDETSLGGFTLNTRQQLAET